MRCQAIRKDGRPCEASVAAGRDTCASHDPGTLAARQPRTINTTTALRRATLERNLIRRRLDELPDLRQRLIERLAAVEARITRYSDHDR